MIGKKLLGLAAVFLLLLVIATPVLAEEKTIQLNIPGCSTWGLYARISSILKGLEGVIRFGSPAVNLISITFDDLKTDEKKITQALDRGGVTLPGKQMPAQGAPSFYK